MINKLLMVIALSTIIGIVPAFAGPATGCNKIKFFGSYTRPTLNLNVIGDNSLFHSYTFQLNIHSDGTATQNWTGLPDLMNNLGTGSPWTGSWTCRVDGKLVVTLISATYVPVQGGVDISFGSNDISLLSHSRTTYLFSVDDTDTLTRVLARTRLYGPNDDPTDPAGGALQNPVSTPATYKRLVASDADLLAP